MLGEESVLLTKAAFSLLVDFGSDLGYTVAVVFIMQNNKQMSAEWKSIVLKYQKPSVLRAAWQIINTIGSYLALWGLLRFSLQVSWWLAVPVSLLAGGLLVRIFIIFHDCGHGSFFRSSRANDVLGFITGMLTFTPYYHWRWEHSIHHASAGDLDSRGTGDVWTMTVQEYLEASNWKKFAYRLARNPIVLFFIAPVFLFLIRQRFASSKASKRERHSVYAMNVAILAMMLVGCLWLGVVHFLVVQLIVLAVAGGAGVWMFYVQHQFEDVYWERGENWDFVEAALKGSSFYKLPRILQWFTGNIGFHHIHHLSPRIPNYNLARCHYANPLFLQVKPVTFWMSLKTLNYRLWDEKNRRLVGFGYLRSLTANA